MNAVIQSLLALSRMSKRPAFGAIFLLNNVSFLRTQLLVERAAITAILSRPSQELLNSNFRTAKAGYFDANFSPLLQTLIDEKDKGKSAVKEHLILAERSIQRCNYSRPGIHPLTITTVQWQPVEAPVSYCR